MLTIFMNIAHINGYDLPIPPVKGGAVEHWIYEVVNRLTLHQRTVFSTKPESYPANANIINGINYQWSRLTAFDKFMRKRIGLERVIEFNPLILKNRIKDCNFDIWHVHNSPFIVTFLKKACQRSKIILHLHNNLPDQIKTTFPRNLKPFHKSIDHVIAVSESIRKEALNYIPNTIKTTVIHNGVDANRFKPVSLERSEQIKKEYGISLGRKIILYVGRLVPQKGVHVLIKAFKEITSAHPNAMLIIVGSHFFSGSSMKTPYILKLMEQASGISNNVIFLGYVPYHKLHNLYAIADICVVPSVWNEPFALTNLEAQASGKALIASRIGGIPEIIKDKGTGLLIEPNNSSALVESISMLLKNTDLRIKMGQNARNHILSNFTWEHIAARCEEIYANILRR